MIEPHLLASRVFGTRSPHDRANPKTISHASSVWQRFMELTISFVLRSPYGLRYRSLRWSIFRVARRRGNCSRVRGLAALCTLARGPGFATSSQLARRCSSILVMRRARSLESCSWTGVRKVYGIGCLCKYAQEIKLFDGYRVDLVQDLSETVSL